MESLELPFLPATPAAQEVALAALIRQHHRVVRRPTHALVMGYFSKQHHECVGEKPVNREGGIQDRQQLEFALSCGRFDRSDEAARLDIRVGPG